MNKYSSWINYLILVLGIVTFSLTMYESFYPHGTAFTHCFTPDYFGPHPKQNSFTIVMGLVSFILLSIAGYKFFKKLPNLKQDESELNFMADNNDLGPHS